MWQQTQYALKASEHSIIFYTNNNSDSQMRVCIVFALPSTKAIKQPLFIVYRQIYYIVFMVLTEVRFISFYPDVPISFFAICV